jgi:hypothetical protein
MEKTAEKNKKEDLMIDKKNSTCLCLVCNSVYLDNPDDVIFKPLRRKEYVVDPGSNHHFDEHLTRGIHGLCVPKYCEKHSNYQESTLKAFKGRYNDCKRRGMLLVW